MHPGVLTPFCLPVILPVPHPPKCSQLFSWLLVISFEGEKPLNGNVTISDTITGRSHPTLLPVPQPARYEQICQITASKDWTRFTPLRIHLKHTRERNKVGQAFYAEMAGVFLFE